MSRASMNVLAFTELHLPRQFQGSQVGTRRQHESAVKAKAMVTLAKQWCQVWDIAWVAQSHMESLLWDIIPGPALLRDKQKIPSDDP